MSILFVPLRSNARALVAGSGVESVRRRLKAASILFDEIYLEAGGYIVQAGPHASATLPLGVGPGRSPLSWDSTHSRSQAKGKQFSLAMAPEATPGVPSSGPYRTVAASDASICWRPTLEPFSAELEAAKADWFRLVGRPELSDATDRQMRDWRWRDEHNKVLSKALPIYFVRKQVIDHATDDLGAAVEGGAAISADLLHHTVMEERFRDREGWRFVGFALNILFPEVAHLPWEAVSQVRAHKDIDYFRKTLQDVEQRAWSDDRGDVEALVHQLYAGQLSKAVEKVGNLGSIARSTSVGFVVGFGAGLATIGVTGPVGPLVGPAISSAIGAVWDYGKQRTRRRRAGWVSLDARLREMSGA